MRHPSTRAERLKIKEKKDAKKLQAAERREERLRRKALLSKEAEDGTKDDYEGNLK